MGLGRGEKREDVPLRKDKVKKNQWCNNVSHPGKKPEKRIIATHLNELAGAHNAF